MSNITEPDDFACFESVPEYSATNGSTNSQLQQAFVHTSLFGESTNPNSLGLSKIVTSHIICFQSKGGCSAIRHNVWSSEGLPIYITMVLNDTNVMAKPLATPMVHSSSYKHYKF